MTPRAENPLTAEEITSLLSGTRTRGGYLARINGLVKSDDLYVDFMALPEYQEKNPASVKNSVNLNIDKFKTAHPDGPELKCIQTKDNRVLLINVSKHNETLADDSEDDVDDDTSDDED